MAYYTAKAMPLKLLQAIPDIYNVALRPDLWPKALQKLKELAEK